MTAEESVRLDNLETQARILFQEAAERQIAYDAWLVAGGTLRPFGEQASADAAADAVEKWRDYARDLEVLTDPSADPPEADGEPDGLSGEMSLLYRQFAAQVEAVE